MNPNKYIYIPIKNNHTGIKPVKNLSTDLQNPKPCFRCYFVNTRYCNSCFDYVNSPKDVTYCSWEQFRINANWTYYPNNTMPETKKVTISIQKS